MTSAGQVISWGSYPGQAAVPAPPAGDTYTAIAASYSHSLALTSSGTVVTWGYLLASGEIAAPWLPTGQTYTAIAAATTIPSR
ncbi:hypothetical protein GS528_28120 [Rhodococcus hoagii]|nr:hypothetical protein [Prescottella equi]